MTRVGHSTGEIMVCLVVNGTKLPHEEALIAALTGIPGMASITLNTNTEKTNVIMGRKQRLLWGRPYIEDTIGAVRFRISPLSFFQVNPLHDGKAVRKSTGIRRTDWGRNRLGSLLRHRHNLPLPRAESKESLRRRDRPRRDRGCQKKCRLKRLYKCRIFCRQSRRSPAGKI